MASSLLLIVLLNHLVLRNLSSYSPVYLRAISIIVLFASAMRTSVTQFKGTKFLVLYNTFHPRAINLIIASLDAFIVLNWSYDSSDVVSAREEFSVIRIYGANFYIAVINDMPVCSVYADSKLIEKRCSPRVSLIFVCNLKKKKFLLKVSSQQE